MSPGLLVQCLALVLAIGCAALAYWVVRLGLQELLERTVIVPGGVIFYRRAFLLTVVFVALGEALGTGSSLKPGAEFMEYVWAVANGVGTVLVTVALTLGVFVVLMTILVAAIKPRA